MRARKKVVDISVTDTVLKLFSFNDKNAMILSASICSFISRRNSGYELSCSSLLFHKPNAEEKFMDELVSIMESTSSKLDALPDDAAKESKTAAICEDVRKQIINIVSDYLTTPKNKKKELHQFLLKTINSYEMETISDPSFYIQLRQPQPDSSQTRSRQLDRI